MAGEHRRTGPVVGSCEMPGFQVMSDLLTIREKNIIYSLLQKHSTLIKCTVAQVLQSSQEAEGALSWRSLASGVLCVIRDHSINTYALRLFSVEKAELLWEHEVYVPFKYTALRTYFHTFPADGHQVGFNFANEMEAEEFHFAVKAVQEDLDTRSFENTSERDDSRPEDSDTRERTLPHTDRRMSSPALSPTAETTFNFDFELDAFLKHLVSQSRLTQDDLRKRSVTDIVDTIIAQYGGAQAVQKELRRRSAYGSGSMTLPRSSGSTHSHQRTPTFPGEQTPSMYKPSVKIKKSASFNVPADGGKDALLSALREVLRKRQLQQNENE